LLAEAESAPNAAANNDALYLGLCVWFDVKGHKTGPVGQNSDEELASQMQVDYFQLWMQLAKMLEVALDTRRPLDPLSPASHRRGAQNRVLAVVVEHVL
jgi:hypothetical protein